MTSNSTVVACLQQAVLVTAATDAHVDHVLTKITCATSMMIAVIHQMSQDAVSSSYKDSV